MQIRGDEENPRKKEKTNMQTRTYQEIEIKKLTPNPWNPRKNFEGPDFEDLKNSIKTNGVLEPILVRPMKKGMFEIVAGERRYRASVAIAEANGGINGQKIPTIVQEMSDDQAIEIMTIENLQRKDLTDLEEANNFRFLVDRRGDDYIPELAGKLGCTSAYIRRRINLLRNPEPILKAWEQGKIKSGHCEELARLSDDKVKLTYFKRLVMKDDYDPKIGEKIESVRELREEINSESLELAAAKFDIKEECLSCSQNSDQQKKLFGDAFDARKSHCLDPKCFKKKQNEFFMTNWKKLRGKSGTNGFRFIDNCPYGSFNEFSSHHGKPGQKCKECPQFVSRIDITGKILEGQICVGKKECYNEVRAESKRAEKNKLQRAMGESPAAAPDPGVSKHPWHGEFYREKFYKERIPEVMNAILCDALLIFQTLLAGILDNNSGAKRRFAIDHGMIKEDEPWLPILNDIWNVIKGMNKPEVVLAIRQAAIDMILTPNFGSDMRHNVACNLGISLSRDWRLNREYLEAKTTKELFYLGEVLGIFKDEKALKYLYEVLLKKRKRFNTCKKNELIDVFLESGIDLAGKVPDEILVDKVIKRESPIPGAGESEDIKIKCNVERDKYGICGHLREMRKMGDCVFNYKACCSECPEDCKSRCNDAEPLTGVQQ